MFCGYVNKRNSPISPPSMQRVFCVLWGTLLLDYENEEESKSSMSPRASSEILGVAEWDGQGRATKYNHTFLLITHTGETFYLASFSKKDKEEWLLHVRRALECNFANPDVVAFKPVKLLQRLPPLSSSRVCCKTKAVLVAGSTYHCKMCGSAYSSSEFVQETSPFLQLGIEEADKCCLNCKLAQAVELWLRSLNYVHIMTIHEFSPRVNTELNRFKATFKLRRRLSQNLDMAAQLLEQKDINEDEYEELRQVDHDYRWEKAYEESKKLKEALDTIGYDMHMIVSLLIHPQSTDSGGRMAYSQVILRLLEIADKEPELIDFYLPQLLQAHLLEACNRSVPALIKLDLLQQALLVLAVRYPSLGLKMAWLLLSTIGDYYEKRVNQTQYAATVALLLQLEMTVTGSVSAVADVPLSKVLAGVLQASSHQKHELACDVSTLFLVRRRLQEDYDAETERRLKRYVQNSAPMASKSAAAIHSQAMLNAQEASDGSSSSMTCFQLLHQLGVGQAGSKSHRGDDGDAGEVVKDNDAEACAIGFPEQIDFVDTICQMAESLRFIPRELRTDAMRKEVSRLNSLGESAMGWDPTAVAGEPAYRIVRVCVDDCRVFRTKARAPTMIVCEVRRQDVSQEEYERRQRAESTTSEEWDGAGLRDPETLDELVNSSSPGGGASNEGKHSFRRKRSGSVTDIRVMDQVDCLVDSKISKAIADIQTHMHVMEEEEEGEEEGEGESTETATRTVEPESVLRSNAAREPLHQPEASHSPASSPVQPSRAERHSLGALPPKSETKRNAPVQPSNLMRRAPTQSLHMHDSNPQTINVVKATIDSMAADDLSPRKPSSKDQKFFSHLGTAADQGVHQIESMFKKMVKSTSTPSLSDLGSASENTSDKLLSSKSDYSPSRLHPTRVARSHSGAAPGPDRMIVSTSLSNAASFARNAVHAISNTIGTVAAEPAAAITNSAPWRMADSATSKLMKRPNSAMLSSSRKTTGLTNLLGSGTDDILTAARLSVPSPAKSVSTTLASSMLKKLEEEQRVLRSAQKLLEKGTISRQEFDQLVSGDGRYRGESDRLETEVIQTRVGSAYGESWAAKKERILQSRFDRSSDGYWPVWDLRCFIVKSNDDLRQEVCCLQLMELCREIFEDFGLSSQLWLKPYRIVSTSNSTGLVQVLTDAMSLDALKKTAGFVNLPAYFLTMYGSSPEKLNIARRNFMSSLAAYSLFTYFLFIKDRHNGNILIDTEGHIIHIDFGFMLSIAPGGAFSLESAPFKLTEELVDVIGGLESPMFNEFVKAFTAGFLALRANAEAIIASLQVLSLHSPFPCFIGKDPVAIIDKLRSRFRTDLSVKDVVQHCLELVISSYGNYGTKQYDQYQRMTNGIFA